MKKSRELISLKIDTVFNFIYYTRGIVQRGPVTWFYSSAFSFLTLYPNFLQGKTKHTLTWAQQPHPHYILHHAAPPALGKKKIIPYSVP